MASTEVKLVAMEVMYQNYSILLEAKVSINSPDPKVTLPASFTYDIRDLRYDIEDKLREVEENVRRYQNKEYYSLQDNELRMCVTNSLCQWHPVVHLIPVKNQYWGAEPNKYAYGNQPWYEVPTCIGTLIIGKRKRVWVLDWSKTVLETKAIDLFDDEVTKVEREIHAHSYEDLSKYINKVMVSAFDVEQPVYS